MTTELYGALNRKLLIAQFAEAMARAVAPGNTLDLIQYEGITAATRYADTPEFTGLEGHKLVDFRPAKVGELYLDKWTGRPHMWDAGGFDAAPTLPSFILEKVEVVPTEHAIHNGEEIIVPPGYASVGFQRLRAGDKFISAVTGDIGTAGDGDAKLDIWRIVVRELPRVAREPGACTIRWTVKDVYGASFDELMVPNGYRFKPTGGNIAEFRRPNKGDFYLLSRDGNFGEASGGATDYLRPYLILEKA